MNIEETYKKVKKEFLEYSKTTLSVELGKKFNNIYKSTEKIINSIDDEIKTIKDTLCDFNKSEVKKEFDKNSSLKYTLEDCEFINFLNKNSTMIMITMKIFIIILLQNYILIKKQLII